MNRTSIAPKAPLELHEKVLLKFVRDLDISKEQHLKAVKFYEAIGVWLSACPVLGKLEPSIFSQGSFLLGTIIKPVTEANEYDIDLVCELMRATNLYSQYDIKQLVGNRLKQHHDYKHFLDEEGKCYFLEGQVSIVGQQYTVLLQIHSNYPHGLPMVWEVSQAIPRNPNFHVNEDNSLCIVVEPERVQMEKKGMTHLAFIQQLLVPHLAMQTHKLLYGNYPLGEYVHGQEGIQQYFLQLLRLHDKQQLITTLNQFLKATSMDRQANCFCKSGLKFKICHEWRFQALRLWDKTYLKKILFNLL